MDATALEASISQLAQAFSQRMDKFEEQHSQPGSSTGELPSEYATFKTFVLTSMRALQGQIALLANQVDAAEIQRRRKMLMLHGIPKTQKEETSTVVTTAVVSHLKLDAFKAEDIGRCHRMGRSAGKDRPRPILIKLRDVTLRDKLWSLKSNLKGSGITLSEFLTKTRHDVFVAARLRFGINRSWSSQGEVFVLGQDGTRHRVRSLADLDGVSTVAAAKKASKKVPVKEAKETDGSSRAKRTIASKK